MVLHPQNETLSYTDLIQSLSALCHGGRDGIMFIVTDNHHSVRIGLAHGQIVNCRYRNLHGINAVAQVFQVQSGKYSFSDGASGDVTDALPSTSDLLALLRGAAARSGPSSDELQAARPLRVTEDALIEIVTRELAQSLGPMAGAVVADYATALRSADNGEQLRDILTRLSDDIGDPKMGEHLRLVVLKAAL